MSAHTLKGIESAMTMRPRRSVLYMPGSNARAIEKARTLPVDAVILDLEDSVAPDAKAAARAQVADAVIARGFGAREVVVRVNGFETPWHADDVTVVAHAAPDAMLVPKISAPRELDAIGQRLFDLKTDLRTRIWAMIETPLAVFNILALAAEAQDSETRLAAFVLGTNDLAKETRARIVPGRAPMLPWLMSCVAAARIYGIDVIDGVFNDLGDGEGFARECAQARKIIAAFEQPENRDKGVVALDGRMMERLHADMARRTLAIHEAIEARRS